MIISDMLKNMLEGPVRQSPQYWAADSASGAGPVMFIQQFGRPQAALAQSHILDLDAYWSTEGSSRLVSQEGVGLTLLLPASQCQKVVLSRHSLHKQLRNRFPPELHKLLC